jgi:hypothetical protein
MVLIRFVYQFSHLLCFALLTTLSSTANSQTAGQVSPIAQSAPESKASIQKNDGSSTGHHLLRPQTIYIDTPPDAQPIKVEIVKKLQNWGEVKIVTLPEQADIILQMVQSEKLNMSTGSGNRGSVVLKNRRTGEDMWSQSRGGAWSMRGWSNAAIGKKLGDDLIKFLSNNHVLIDKPE